MKLSKQEIKDSFDKFHENEVGDDSTGYIFIVMNGEDQSRSLSARGSGLDILSVMLDSAEALCEKFDIDFETALALSLSSVDVEDDEA